jgi:hypothetical protein
VGRACPRLARVENGRTQIVVDNSAGGDSELAAEVVQLLQARGLAIELRSPDPFDTSVHLLSAGLVIRVPQVPDRPVLEAIEADVRTALLHRPSLRRRTRSVPVHLGESARVIEWIDLFG